MNRSGLIAELAVRENITARKATEVVDMVFGGFTDALRTDGRIEIRGFGSFSMRHYEPYTGRNPKTGQKIAVKRKGMPFFKVGKDLKERVNNGK